ncbi:MAG TPA: hypothetical protein VFF95_08640 [Candidatus Binatus sp.]|nr:hypothetical protein [Candidatus Binatus sp.]
MSSLSSKDRVSLCLFSFTDGRRCRTPRTARHPHFCFYHAQKEAHAQAAEKLAKDLSYFFSNDYLSACDLSTALSRLIPAVIRGDIKPRLARTVAYMFQTQLQAIHLSQHEYINAFGSDGWRKAVRTSVNGNHDYLFPPDPDENSNADAEPPAQVPAQPTSPTPVGAGLAQPAHPQQPAQAPPQSPAGSVAARLQPATSTPATQTTAQPNAHPSRPQQSAHETPQPRNVSRPSPATVEAALSVARELFPPGPNSTLAQSAPPAEACHPERSESPRLDPAASPNDETRSASAPAQSPQPNNAPPPTPPRQPAAPNRDPYAVHFDHNYRLREDRKLL